MYGCYMFQVCNILFFNKCCKKYLFDSSLFLMKKVGWERRLLDYHHGGTTVVQYSSGILYVVREDPDPLYTVVATVIW